MPAEHLRIQVTVQGRVVASLTFPARAVEDLGDLVPEHIVSRLKADGLDPQAIGQQAAAAGFPPGDLFASDDGNGKQVRLWLE